MPMVFMNFYHEERCATDNSFNELVCGCTVHSSSTIDSYGDYLFAISMEIYHKISEDPD